MGNGNLWLARFAYSRGFCMGEYGDFVLERNIITTTRNISNIYYRLFVAKFIIL